MKNEILMTNKFRLLFEKLDIDKQNQILKIKTQLESTLLIGKPLNYKWLREKKIKGFRLYFIINFELKRVLFVAFGDKKEQQKIIDKILEFKEDYFLFLKSY
jgi:mRNA-degrading endonuclease RelE of RelBE toxin-antitoxin system